MKELKITFSFRDWEKGQRILQMLGFISDDWMLTDSHKIEIIDEEDLQILKSELDSLDCEFVIQEL